MSSYVTACVKEKMLRHMLDDFGGWSLGSLWLGFQMRPTNGDLVVLSSGDQGYGSEGCLSGFLAHDHVDAPSWTYSVSGTGESATVTATNASEVDFGTAIQAASTVTNVILEGHDDDMTSAGSGECLAIASLVDDSGAAISRSFEVGDQVRFPVGALRITL